MSGGGAEVPASRRFEDSTVRVTNLPEETVEDDLREIFRRFGSIVRVYLSRDRRTGMCKGFAFVSYETREEAERALRVNGHGYQNLIMRVEMSEPSSLGAAKPLTNEVGHALGEEVHQHRDQLTKP